MSGIEKINLVSANTDGLTVLLPESRAAEYESICSEWMKTTGFELEFSNFAFIARRDVNNYIAKTTNGKIKAKGGLSPLPIHGDLQHAINGEIIKEAVVNHLSNGADIEQVIRRCTDLRRFVFTKKSTHGACWGKVYLGKHIRWYYTRDTVPDITTFKKNKAGAIVRIARGARAAMTLPDTLPADLDYDRYVAAAKELLASVSHPADPATNAVADKLRAMGLVVQALYDELRSPMSDKTQHQDVSGARAVAVITGPKTGLIAVPPHLDTGVGDELIVKYDGMPTWKLIPCAKDRASALKRQVKASGEEVVYGKPLTVYGRHQGMQVSVEGVLSRTTEITSSDSNTGVTPRSAKADETQAVTYSLGKDTYDNAPIQCTAENFDAFEGEILSIRSSRKGLTYVCAAMDHGPYDGPQPDKYTGDDSWRLRSHAMPRGWFPFDFDGFDSPARFDALLDFLKQYRGFAYTTSSSKPEAPRARAILALSRPATREENMHLGPALAALMGPGIKFDKSVYQSEQQCYCPTQGCELFSFRGEVVDVDAVLAAAPSQTTSGQSSSERISSAAHVDALVQGEDVHGNTRDLVAQLVRVGFNDENIRLTMAGLAPQIEAARGTERVCALQGDELERMISGARAKGYGDTCANSAPAEISYANLSDLDTNPPPDRAWCVRNWLPIGTVAALFSPGGHGKSLLGQQIATHVAAGIDIFGERVTQGNVVAIFCEDENEELRRRQIAIDAALGLPSAPTGLYLSGRVGEANTLLSFDGQGMPHLAVLFERLDAECSNKTPVLLIVDNIAQVYAGSEIDRHQVTVFCNALSGLAKKHKCALLLLGHTAKAEGSQFSGSTAWDAAVRSRLWLERTEEGLLKLGRMKANYANREDVMLEWRHGYLHAIHAGVGSSPLAQAAAEKAVVDALIEITKAQITSSNSPQARNFLPKLMESQGKLVTVTRAAAEQALTRLVEQGRIIPNSELGWKTASRHPATGLALAPPTPLATIPTPTPQAPPALQAAQQSPEAIKRSDYPDEVTDAPRDPEIFDHTGA